MVEREEWLEEYDGAWRSLACRSGLAVVLSDTPVSRNALKTMAASKLRKNHLKAREKLYRKQFIMNF